MERYSATNDIRGLDGAADFGIIESPNSDDVNWSNAAQGQGGGRGKKPQGEGHEIYGKTITALNGESNVGKFSFHNLVVDFSNGGQGQARREFEDICHNIRGNKITADKRSTKVGFEDFGNVNYNCKTTSTKDHGKAAGGSSSAQGQGGGGGTKPKGDGYNIRGNNIKGDGVPKAYHNFDNFECNLKTTNTEDGGSTNQFIIYKNEITARNKASYVGMFNFHNVYINAARKVGFLKPEKLSIRHNIEDNTIVAVNSRKVGIQDFGNIKYNCGSFISRLLDFLG